MSSPSGLQGLRPAREGSQGWSLETNLNHSTGLLLLNHAPLTLGKEQPRQEFRANGRPTTFSEIHSSFLAKQNLKNITKNSS